MDAHYCLGVKFYTKRKFTEAIQHFELSLINEPTWKNNAIYRLGVCHQQINEHARAIYYFKQNVQYNCYDSIYQLAISYHAGLGVPKHYGKAVKYYKLCDALRTDSDDDIFDEQYIRCLCDLSEQTKTEYQKQNYVLAYELSLYNKGLLYHDICKQLQTQYMLKLMIHLHKDICNIVCDYLIEK